MSRRRQSQIRGKNLSPLAVDIQTVNKRTDRCTILLVTREKHIKNSIRYHHANTPTSRISKNEKNDNKKC